MIRVLCILFSVVVFLLIAAKVIDDNTVRWAAAAIAVFMASFLPFSDVAIPRRNQAGFLDLSKIAVFIGNWPEYRKALGAFVGSLLTGLAAIVGLGVLAGVPAGYVAAAIAFLTPIAAFLNSYRAKANGTPPTP
jgi:hypothetical protein